MKQYSPAFIAALTAMSLITDAHAENTALTPDQIGRLYIAEMKIPGTTLRCFQNGIEIIHEPGLRDLRITADDMTALRLDGAAIRVLPGANALCLAVSRPDPGHDE